MKTFMVLSGGTNSAFSYCKAIKKILPDSTLIVCDTNPYYLVPSSGFADKFLSVLPIKNSSYYEYMLKIFDEYKPDFLIPIIDLDLQLFANDSPDLVSRGIVSTAPQGGTFSILGNKEKLGEELKTLNIATPRQFDMISIDEQTRYFVKPKIGFGSNDTRIMTGNECKSLDFDNAIVQELCAEPEVSADAFCINKKVHCICRERIAVKSGVCTKARVFYDKEITKVLQKIADAHNLPLANCVQFMKNSKDEYALTDFNLRLGSGSALSAAVGFKMAEAVIAYLTGKPYKASLQNDGIEHFVVRYYEEIVTK